MKARRRWPIPIEVLWWIETGAAVILIPTPGFFAGILLTPFFLPVLISYLRHNRSLGQLGYWYSVAMISAQSVLIVALPLYASMPGKAWLAWAPAALVFAWLGIRAWFARPV